MAIIDRKSLTQSINTKNKHIDLHFKLCSYNQSWDKSTSKNAIIVKCVF